MTINNECLYEIPPSRVSLNRNLCQCNTKLKLSKWHFEVIQNGIGSETGSDKANEVIFFFLTYLLLPYSKKTDFFLLQINKFYTHFDTIIY